MDWQKRTIDNAPPWTDVTQFLAHVVCEFVITRHGAASRERSKLLLFLQSHFHFRKQNPISSCACFTCRICARDHLILHAAHNAKFIHRVMMSDIMSRRPNESSMSYNRVFQVILQRKWGNSRAIDTLRSVTCYTVTLPTRVLQVLLSCQISTRRGWELHVNSVDVTAEHHL